MMNPSLDYYFTAGTKALLVFWLSLSVRTQAAGVSDLQTPRSPLPGWRMGSDQFPIAVWLQSPANAERYKAAGINLYIGLWRGPNSEQLATLSAAGMPVICAQTEFALAHKDDPTIVGWMHDDEPDNAQSLGRNRGYGPPITPETIQSNYARIHQADPTRPVLLNLGQGVAWDDYIGRGVRRRHPEDYPKYIRGSDIVSFDIYPVVHDDAAIKGRLEYVARGVERLQRWTEGKKIVWNCIECTHISNPAAKATPDQIRAEVWMSIVRGSRGLIYFVHQFSPKFVEAALLEDPENLAGISRINAEVQALAPAIFSKPVADGSSSISCDSTNVATMFREWHGTNFLFAASMTGSEEKVRFSGPRLQRSAPVEVISENRTVQPEQSALTDTFRGYGVHLYRWPK